MRTLFRRLRNDETGQALAEFALVLPLLLLLIAGIIEFGRAFHIQQVVTDAAREGARLTVVQDPTVPNDSVVKARVSARLANNGIDPANATISITPLAEWRNTGSLMTVSVTVPYRMGFVSSIAKFWGGGGDIVIGSHTVMRNE